MVRRLALKYRSIEICNKYTKSAFVGSCYSHSYGERGFTNCVALDVFGRGHPIRAIQLAQPEGWLEIFAVVHLLVSTRKIFSRFRSLVVGECLLWLSFIIPKSSVSSQAKYRDTHVNAGTRVVTAVLNVFK
jgi:hypothetical protein